MAKGGARAGAGRRVGSKDRATLEAELAAAQQQLLDLTKEKEAARAARGRKQAVDVLDDIMHAGYGLMAKHQPLEPGEVQQPGRDPSEEKFRHYLDVTKDAAKALANYQSPKFKSVTIAVDPSLAAAGTPSSAAPAAAPGTLEQLSPAQSYRMLRDHDMIDLAPAPNQAAAPAAAPAKKRA